MVTVMPKKQRQYLVHEILASAGITINGTMPWDIRINDERFYERIALEGEPWSRRILYGWLVGL